MEQHKPVKRFWYSVALAIIAAFVFAVIIQPSGEGTGGLEVGAVAPEITAPGWINGEAPTAADIEGKVVVVDSWAYW